MSKENGGPAFPAQHSIDLSTLTLSNGCHSSPEQGHCLLEVVSMFAGEPFTDHPACVDPVLAAFGRIWNDDMRSDREREQLKRYIPLLPGTAQGDKLSQRRAFMAIDWSIRISLPAWLDLLPALAEHAARLRALAPITGQQQLADATPIVERAGTAVAVARAASSAAVGDAAWDDAWDAWDAGRTAAKAIAKATAWDAAWDAAWAAAWDAAWAAAWAAAWDATRAAVWDATWAAGRAAAWDAAPGAERAAADAALAPTVEKLQASAHDLYLAMIDAKADEAAALDAAERLADEEDLV